MRYKLLVIKIKCDLCDRIVGVNKKEAIKFDNLDFCDKVCCQEYENKNKRQHKLFTQSTGLSTP